MSKRLASFNYEDVRYVVTLDGGYLQNEFAGRNAVSINEIQIHPGYSAAVSQPWGAYRPNMCPLSEDASIVKVGDNFIVHGTCGGYRFELTEISYEIEEEKEEDIHVTEETLDAAEELSEEIQATDEPAHVMDETLEAAAELSEELPGSDQSTVTELTDGESGYQSLVGEMPTDEIAGRMSHFVTHHASTKSKIDTTKMCIGRPKHNGVRINASVNDTRKESSTLIVSPVMRKPDGYRGVRIGMSLESKAKNAYVEPKKTASVSAKPVSTSGVNKTHGDTGSPAESVNTIPVAQPVPVSTELNFDDAPKPNLEDFDCQEFLASLSSEQINFLKKVPDSFLGTIHEFTKDPISTAKLESLGAIYCVDNRWKISGDWYAIDEIQTLSRCIYCATTNEYQRISTKTLKGWKKCVEAGVVG